MILSVFFSLSLTLLLLYIFFIQLSVMKRIYALTMRTTSQVILLCLGYSPLWLVWLAQLLYLKATFYHTMGLDIKHS